MWPFAKTRKIKCPDGSERIIFKNPDDAFPLYIKDWSARFKATVKALTEVQGSLSSEFKRQIGGFFFELDSSNLSMQSKFSAAYKTYLASDPCKADGWLRKRIREIMEEESTLRRLEFEIKKMESLGNQGLNEQAIEQAMAEALNRLSKSEIEEETSNAFKEVEKNISGWRTRTQ